MKRILSTLAFLSTCLAVLAIDVTLTTEDNVVGTGNIRAAERNLAKVLTEINAAQKAKRYVETSNLAMDEFAAKSLARMWATTPFYCDEEELVERCWMFKDGSMMVNNIPLIITPEGETFGMGTYQEAVAEFDRNGRLTDFRLSLNAQMGESMDHCGDIVSQEQRHIILKTVEMLRTAYCQKDIETISKFYSDDALIITGKVIKTKASEYAPSKTQVSYTRQTKTQYINKLKRVFKYNKWLDVRFTPVDEDEIGGCGGVTQSNIDSKRFGVRLVQEWNSQNYSDVGYLFLLWEFPTDGRDPIIHVRTWQPIEETDGKRNAPDDNISTLGAWGL